MRLIQLVTTIIAVAVVWLLFELPGQVAEHIFIGWVADGVRALKMQLISCIDRYRALYPARASSGCQDHSTPTGSYRSTPADRDNYPLILLENL